jgi:nucleoid-associated protein YgaU
MRPVGASNRDVSRPAAPVAQVPSANAFDRRYEVPENRVRPGAAAASPSARETGGIPVTLRPQPELVVGTPPPPGGSTVMVQSEPVAQRPQPISTGQVEVFDVAQYIVRPGDTFASISQVKYGSGRYQQALALFNRERDARLDALLPGRSIYLPPADYLERRYGLAAPVSRPGAVSNANPRVQPVTREYSVPEPAVAGTASAGNSVAQTSGSFEVAGNQGEKRYRVGANETIWGIAKKTLGTGERWPEILRLNREQLRDVNQLRAGMVLRLPSDARVDAADTLP